MAELFADLPEALANTLVIARRCAFRVPSQAPILPAFPTSAGHERGRASCGRAAQAGLERAPGAQIDQPGMDAAEQRGGRPGPTASAWTTSST